MYSPELPIPSVRRLSHQLPTALLVGVLALTAADITASTPSTAKAAVVPPAGPSEKARAEAAFEFARAKLLADSGDFDKALAAYKRTIELDPGDPYSLVELARFQAYLAQIARSAAYQRELLEEAARVAGLAKNADPENADVLETYGQVHMRLGELDPGSASLALAQGAFEILRKKQPTELPVLLSLGQLYLWQQDAAKAVEVLETAAKTSPGHRMVLNMLVEAQLAAEENEGAIDSLRQLLRAEPTNAEHRIRLAELLANNNQHREAVEVLEGAPPEMASSQRLRQLLARELHLVGRNREALALVDELAVRFPGHEGMRRLRAAVLTGLTRYREAIAELEPMVSRQTDAERRRQDAMLLARLEERVGDIDGAVKRVEPLLENSSGASLAEATLVLTGIYDRSGRDREAEELLRTTLAKVQGEDALAIGSALARFLGQRARPDEAFAIFSDLRGRLVGKAELDTLAWRQTLTARELENWPRVLESLQFFAKEEKPEIQLAVLQLRVEALTELGRTDEALGLLGPGTLLSPQQARVQRWETLEKAGRTAEVEAEQAGLLAGGQKEDLRLMVQVLQQKERWADAVPLFEKLLAAEPEARDLIFGLAVSYERSGQAAPAVELFEKLLKLDPDAAGVLNYLGYMWAEKGENLDRALELILRAVALEPDNGAYVDSLGWVYYQLGRYAEAREHLEWAVRLVPDDATLYEHLAAVYAKVGDKAKKKEALVKAIELEKKADKQAELRRQLEALEKSGAGPG